jgi:UDP-2,4-diacetamido-2,4,6-trideoxy-beta-L-altropyranose hydrolase
MKIFFRVDASRIIGTGHVMRCLSLANALRENGHTVHFITRDHSNNLNHIISQQCFGLTVLPKPINDVDGEFNEDYATWPGVTQSQDAQETIFALAGQKPNWLIVDHYGFDAEWENLLRGHAQHLMVIDDLANRSHNCDILVDQNFSLSGKNRYKDLVPKSCFIASGPLYALLKPEYRIHRQSLPLRNGDVKRLLVFFGGSDPFDLTSKTLDAISSKDFDHLDVDLVVGINHRRYQEIEMRAKQRPQTLFHSKLPHLAGLMQKADLALGAGGGTTWERMCLNLPSIVVILAENQRPTAEALEKSSFIINLGNHAEVDASKIAVALRKCLSHPDEVKSLSERINGLVDGHGALRIVKILESSLTRNLWIQPEITTQELNTFRIFSGELDLGKIFIKVVRDSIQLTTALNESPFADQIFSQVIKHTLSTYYSSVPKKLGTHRVLPFLAPPKTSGIKLAILSDENSWINDYMGEFVASMIDKGHEVLWVHDKADLRSADFCFYLSCGQLVSKNILSLFKHNLVVHESSLPQGKGWSPLSWQILEGKNKIPVTLFEAAEKVDSGPIYAQDSIDLEGHELVNELRAKQAGCTFKLCHEFVDKFPAIIQEKKLQVGEESFYKRRMAKDSMLDIHKSLSEQFNILRIVDNESYPAYFELNEQKYIVKVSKAES